MFQVNIAWNQIDLLFGSVKFKNIHVLNKIILTAKKYLYTCKMKKKVPIIDSFNTEINALYKSEKYNALKTHNVQKFQNCWAPLVALTDHDTE